MTNEALRERMLSGGAGGGERRPVEGAPGRDCRPMSIYRLWIQFPSFTAKTHDRDAKRARFKFSM